MNWIYVNNTPAPIFYRSQTWLPDEAHETSLPVPDALGLSCIQEGYSPSPVLLHTDITIPPGAQEIVNIPSPILSHVVSLTIACMTPETGCECRFNHERNTVIPIDVRNFTFSTCWENCSRVFLKNSSDIEALISVTATEAEVGACL